MRYNDCTLLGRDSRVTPLPTVGNKPFGTADASDTRAGQAGLGIVDAVSRCICPIGKTPLLQFAGRVSDNI
jgi:hypothetical protein